METVTTYDESDTESAWDPENSAGVADITTPDVQSTPEPGIMQPHTRSLIGVVRAMQRSQATYAQSRPLSRR